MHQKASKGISTAELKARTSDDSGGEKEGRKQQGRISARSTQHIQLFKAEDANVHSTRPRNDCRAMFSLLRFCATAALMTAADGFGLRPGPAKRIASKGSPLVDEALDCYPFVIKPEERAGLAGTFNEMARLYGDEAALDFVKTMPQVRPVLGNIYYVQTAAASRLKRYSTDTQIQQGKFRALSRLVVGAIHVEESSKHGQTQPWTAWCSTGNDG